MIELPEPEYEHERGSSAGAWAAAALVLALGALIFAVLAHIRASDLEGRVGTLESELAARPSPPSPDGALADPPVPTVAPTAVVPTTVVPPPDPAQARAEVIAAFASVYDPTSGVDARMRLVDDTTGVAAAIRQAEAGPNGAAISTATVNVNDVEFLSPTRAKVIYGLVVPGEAPILGRSGEARVAAGAWKVTRATVCADLEAIGGSCG